MDQDEELEADDSGEGPSGLEQGMLGSCKISELPGDGGGTQPMSSMIFERDLVGCHSFVPCQSSPQPWHQHLSCRSLPTGEAPRAKCDSELVLFHHPSLA